MTARGGAPTPPEIRNMTARGGVPTPSELRNGGTATYGRTISGKGTQPGGTPARREPAGIKINTRRSG